MPIKEGPQRAGDPPALVASSDKIQKELGWKPHYTDIKAIVEIRVELAQGASEGIQGSVII